jgi:acetylornithine/succinyldiaminopimelate/putrescine aminotransferase
MGPGKHGSTFGGNPLACAAGIAVIETIEEGDLLNRTVEMGQYLRGKLEAMKEKYKLITNIKQLGLMFGVELAVPGDAIATMALEKGLRINCTQQTILRLMPAMTVTAQELDRVVEILDSVFTEFEEKLAKESQENTHVAS